MATLSFDEILQLAKSQSEQRNKNDRNDLIAQSLSGFVNTLLNSGGKREMNIGGISPETGEFTPYSRPQYSGGNLIERGFDKLFSEGRQSMQNQGGLPLNREQASDFMMKSAIEKQKQSGRESLLMAKLKAQNEAQGKEVKSLDTSMGRNLSDYVYKVAGISPEGKPELTYRGANTILQAQSLDSREFYKDLGIKITLNKDLLGRVPPELKFNIEKQLSGRKSSARDEFIRGVMKKGYTQQEAESLANQKGL